MKTRKVTSNPDVEVDHFAGDSFPQYASILLKRPEVFIKWITVNKIVLLVISLNDELPYKRIWESWTWGRFKISSSSLTAMAIFLRRVWRIEEYRGQRSRKCSVDSSSVEHLHLGFVQLNLWLNLCSRRSLKLTRSRVNNGRPIRSWISIFFYFGGRIFLM